MAHAGGMATESSTIVPVIDYRRQSMVLEWHTLGGTWTAYDDPPALVNGVAFIRPSLPNVCVFAQAGTLRLQIGAHQYVLAENAPRIRCSRRFASFGLRRRFTVESSAGEVLYAYSYWPRRGRDFFRWLAGRAADRDWRITRGQSWTEGLASAALRAE